MRPSIWAQLNARDRDLDSWDEVVEKVVDAEAKASLQLHFKTREIDSKCSQGERPSKAINENKFTHTFSVNWGSD